MSRWTALLRKGHPLLECLKSTGKRRAYIMCEACKCRHTIYPSGETLVACCQCDPPLCEDIEIKDPDDLKLFKIDMPKLLNRMAEALPIDERVRAIPDTPAWVMGRGVLSAGGRNAVITVCLTNQTASIRAAVDGIRRMHDEPCLFLYGGGHKEEIEELLPKGSRACGLDDVFEVSIDGRFNGSPLAGRLLDNRGAEQNRLYAKSVNPDGYWIVQRGTKKTRLSNKPYTLRTWRCDYEGRAVDLPELVGSELIVRLLLQKGKSFYADGLLRSLTGEAAEVADEQAIDWLTQDGKKGEIEAIGIKRRSVCARQEIWDQKTISVVCANIRMLKAGINECGDFLGCEDERHRLESELEEAMVALKKHSRPGPGGMPVPITFTDDIKKAANLAGKQIREVLGQLKKSDDTLWQHLANKEILKFGQVCLYSKEKGYDWKKK